MISLKLHYGPAFTPVTKRSDDEENFSDELDLQELFNHFYEKYGEEFKDLLWDKEKEGKFNKQLVIIINGRTYRGEDFLKTVLKNGDDISFLYVYFGG